MLLTKEDFQKLDLPDLLLNIWSNADKKMIPFQNNTLNGTLKLR